MKMGYLKGTVRKQTQSTRICYQRGKLIHRRWKCAPMNEVEHMARAQTFSKLGLFVCFLIVWDLRAVLRSRIPRKWNSGWGHTRFSLAFLP